MTRAFPDSYDWPTYANPGLPLAFVASITCMGAFAQQPGIILINGKVITVDAKDSTAQTIAISSAKILAVGTNETVRDLHGRTATPGLIDT